MKRLARQGHVASIQLPGCSARVPVSEVERLLRDSTRPARARAGAAAGPFEPSPAA